MPKPSKADEELLSVARKRMTNGAAALADSRESELDDLRFAAGSPDNQWQWPTEVLDTRIATNGNSIGARPCLTINKLPQHIKQVTNDQRQNRPSGNVIPANDAADSEVAEVYNGMIRHIEYDSNADVAYDTACENQVTFGEGYIRIITEYEDENSFDLKITIKRVFNSFSVLMDPLIQDPCGEDAEWAFIYEDMPFDEYERLYPDASPVSSLSPDGVGNQEPSLWMSEKTIRIAEYFYIDRVKKTLNLYPDGHTAFEGTVEDNVYRQNLGEPIKTRQSEQRTVKWCKINGYEVLEKADWPGKHIPIVRVIGNEFEVDGKRYVSGIVRNAKDAQRMYNYWNSQEAEMLALAPKAPFIMYGGQVEGYEQKWKTANTIPYPYLEVNPDVTDGAGNVLPLPQRAQPPMVQHGLIAAKQGASEDIKETTGQYNASLGQTSNERSGKAILARQHEGDKSTYHYVDNLARAVRYVTRQLVDLIPKVYDTARVAVTLGEDGTTKNVKLDPEQGAPVTKVVDPRNPETIIEKIYNPSMGKYGVMVITGPGYATKMQEAADQMGEILQTNPGLWQVAGDLFVKNLNWPGAQEFAKRLKKTIDPKLLGDDDESPEIQQMKQQMQAIQQENQQMHQMLQNVQNSFEARELSIKAYDAETKRIVAMNKAMTPEQMQDIARGTIDAALHTGDISPGNSPLPEQNAQQMSAPGGIQ